MILFVSIGLIVFTPVIMELLNSMCDNVQINMIQTCKENNNSVLIYLWVLALLTVPIFVILTNNNNELDDKKPRIKGISLKLKTLMLTLKLAKKI